MSDLLPQPGGFEGPGRVGVTIYSLVRPGKFALEARQAGEGNRKSAVMAA